MSETSLNAILRADHSSGYHDKQRNGVCPDCNDLRTGDEPPQNVKFAVTPISNHQVVMQRLAEIQDQITIQYAMILEIRETINNANEVIAKVASEVMPTVETLMSHPMVKAFSFGKKKG